MLVTGGAGFIGSHIVTRLVEDGHEVRVLDDLSTGSMSNLSHLSLDEFTMVEGSILDPWACDYAIYGDGNDPVDCVLHQAAIPAVPRSMEKPILTFEVNVRGTLNLLKTLTNNGPWRAGGTKPLPEGARPPKFVMASSSSVYGGATPAVETMAPSTKSPYAAHKACCERLCEAFGHSFGLETVCLRYFNVFGPRQDPDSPYSAVIPAFIRAIRSGETVAIHGDGLQTRDFTYVSNVVDANLLAASTDMQGVFNVGCGRSHDLLELVAALEEVLGQTARVVRADSRAGDVRDSLADTKLIQEFGYKPQVGFKEGLALTIRWFDGQKKPQAE